MSNRRWWNANSDDYQAAHGPRLEATALAWGVWRIAEAELGVLGPVAGRDVLELGCGAAQWTHALRRSGARAVGIDLSEVQLSHARRHASDCAAPVPLVHGSAELLPFRAASFDVVFCDHGATSFAPPAATVAEAARVLRPGGRFAFCMSTPLRDVCWDTRADHLGRALQASYFDLAKIEDEGSQLYQLPYGAWIRLFRRHGFEIEDLIELRPPPGAGTTYEGYAPLDWARAWPAEHIWKLRKSA
jgi:SAM-dependent methyltransferase